MAAYWAVLKAGMKVECLVGMKAVPRAEKME
jgi:hypothetical protein